MTNESPLTKFDPATLRAMETKELGSPAKAFLPANMSEAMELAKLMAACTFVPVHLRGKAGDCLAVVIQAARWEYDAFAIAGKTYFVNDRIAYESQLVHALVNTRAPLQTRLRVSYKGTGTARQCVVSGLLKGETEPHIYESPTIGSIPVKNSPLWKSDPDQQLHYFATRAWARRYVPEVLLGVYTPDDFEAIGPENAKDITPPPRPKIEDYLAPPVATPPPATDPVMTDEQIAEANRRLDEEMLRSEGG